MKRQMMSAAQLAAVSAVAGILLASCGTTAAVAPQPAAQPVQEAPQPKGAQLVDWQGSEFGDPVPDWVRWSAAQNYELLETLSDSDAKGKTLLAVEGYGQDRDLLAVWVETDRASAQLSNRITQTITTDAGTKLSGNKDADDARLKMVQACVGQFSQSTFSGFSRLRTFWTQNRRAADGGLEYRYYALFGIDKALLQEQIAAAMGKVEAKTAEEKDALTDINRLVQASAAKAGGVSAEVK
mgnify:CR=1 FL=1